MKKKFWLMMMLLTAMASAQGTNSISVGTVNAALGETTNISISLDNDEAIRGFQLDLTLPDGINYVAGSAARVASRLTNHSVSEQVQGSGAIRIIVSPNGSAAIAGSSGEVLTLKLTTAAGQTVTTEALEGTVKGIRLSNGGNSDIVLDDVTFDINVVNPTLTLTVPDVNIEKGYSGTVSIDLANAFDVSIFKLSLDLPAGLTYAAGSAAVGSRLSDHALEENAATPSFLASSSTQTPFAGTDGTILTLTLNAASTLSVGDVLAVTVSGIELTSPNDQVYKPDNVSFNVTIVEPTYTELNENATEAPAASDGAVNVRVTRALKAGQWNTICLPFALTEAQVEEAFGSGVKLGDFNGCTVEKDGDDVNAITVNFTEVTAMEANHPYIIKTAGDDITQFIVSGVTVAPTAEPTVSKDPKQVKVSSINVTLYNRFIGNYVAGTTMDDNMLFLSGGKFYYTKDATKTIKAFRGYFAFHDVLTSIESNARMTISFDNETTGIEAIGTKGTGTYYDLRGTAVGNPGKGVYIRNGKKVVIK
ncbi:MAG: hypothetical protein IJ588_12795 [Prevotella sp.]|nr:hypothetical protein [Prevotella sp.]